MSGAHCAAAWKEKMKTWFRGWAALLLLSMVSAMNADAMENVPLDQIPARVKDAVKKSFAGAEIVSVEKDNDRNDFIYYFVHVKQSGHKKKIEINENGLVSKTEDEKD